MPLTFPTTLTDFRIKPTTPGASIFLPSNSISRNESPDWDGTDDAPDDVAAEKDLEKHVWNEAMKQVQEPFEISPNPTPTVTTLQSRLFLPLDFTTPRGKSVSAIIVIRAFYNIASSMIWGFAAQIHEIPWWAAVCGMAWHVADQLVVGFCVGVICQAGGESEVWGVKRQPLDTFLSLIRLLHVMFLCVALVVPLAVFAGSTGGWMMTAVGVLIVIGAFVASRPEGEDGRLRLPA
ncbi:hypothetical protein VTI74DRAFT_11240 [Chaetomium olivicolor]